MELRTSRSCGPYRELELDDESDRAPSSGEGGAAMEVETVGDTVLEEIDAIAPAGGR